MDELRFDGQAAIVTGAARGLGRAHALLLAERGASVVVADLGGAVDGTGGSLDPAEEVVKEIRDAGGTAVACGASVAEAAGAQAIVQTALDAFGRLDIVVNNAGISDPATFHEISMERFHRMLDVQFFGTVYVCKAAWPHFREAGYGRVVNTISMVAFGQIPKSTSYGSAKAALFGFTRTLANEGIRHGIQVNAIAPSANTRMSAAVLVSKFLDISEEEYKDPLGPSFGPEKVSPVVAYLAHESCPLNGETLVTGGDRVGRFAVIATEGIAFDAVTPETVAERIDEVLDPSKYTIVDVSTPTRLA